MTTSPGQETRPDEETPTEVPALEGFNHYGTPELLADPHGKWDELRERYRAFRTDWMDPDWSVWYLTRFEDIYAAHADWETFSSRTVTPHEPVDAHEWLPIEVDPPLHTKYRAFLNPKFTPRAVRAMEAEIREECARVMDPVAARDGCEFISEVAKQFPTTMFMKLMGLPVERSDELLQWIDELLHSNQGTEEGMQTRINAYKKIGEMLQGLIADRREQPRDDLMSYLLTCEVDGRPLNEKELFETSFLLYMAGLDTVAGMMGYTWKHLAENDDHRRMVREQPETIPDAVEEFLRHYSLVSAGRYVTRDVEFAGCPMKQGDRVVISTIPANRDPRIFEQADGFVFKRRPNRHIAFGTGPHRCLGAHLARFELQIALEEWHRRIPDYRVARPEEISHHVSGVAGLNKLYLAW